MVQRRKLLRRNAPEPELFLWSKMKGKQLSGYKFRRQFSIDHYSLDFYCPRMRLDVEVDGKHHESRDTQESDQVRDKYLKSLGIEVLRFTNEEVLERVDTVITKISETLGRLSDRVEQ